MLETPDTAYLDLTAGIVPAQFSNDTVFGEQLPTLIQTVHTALSGLGFEPEPEKFPAVSIKRSVQKDAITCLECGLPKKMLKQNA